VEQKILDKLGELGERSADRRDFLKKAGKAAAAVPAVALLLSANATPAAASGRYGKGKGKGKKKGKKFGLRGSGGGRKVGEAKKILGFSRH
jgi:hypothetical protein